MLAGLLAVAIVIPSGAQGPVDAAIADVAKRHQVEATVVEAERVTWRDGSLGCPRKGVLYTQTLVPGWRIVLAAGDRRFGYHAGLEGEPFECPAWRVRKPLPGPAK